MLEQMRGTDLTHKSIDMIIKMIIKDVSDEDFGKRVCETGNSLQWIVGHMVASRNYMLSILGQEITPYSNGVFDRVMKDEEISSYPSKSELLNNWDDVSNQLADAMEAANTTNLSKEISTDFPIEDKTSYGGILFMTMHDGYHLGQLACLRRLLGYKSLY